MNIFNSQKVQKKKFGGNVHVLFPIFLILTVVALFNSLQVYYSLPIGNENRSNLILILVSKLIYFWYFILLAYVIQWIEKTNSFDFKKKYIRSFVIHFIVLSVSFALHEVIIFSTDFLLFDKPIPTSFYSVFNNQFIWLEIMGYAALLLSFYLIEYRRISRENEIKCTNLEVQLVRSKLKEFRSKIQPSFLFNTLQTIRNLVSEERNKEANSILTALSDFLRITIYDAEQDEITLEEEIRFLNQYIEIEKLRGQRIFEYTENAKSETLNAKVPHFILQPIIEKLVYTDSAYKPIVINLETRINNKKLEILIKCRYNNDAKYELTKISEEPVMNIIQERLIKRYNEEQNFIIARESDNEILIKILIPFLVLQLETEGTFVTENVR